MLGSACATRFWALTWSALRSVPTSNVTRTVIVPSFAFTDWRYSMSSTPFICCSIGVATDCSIVSASAPGYEVWIWMSGGTMSGNCATGRPSIAMSPPRTVRIAMTIATMGLLMKKRAMESLSCGRRQGHRRRRARSRRSSGVAGRDDRPRFDPREPFHDDALTGLQALFDHPQAPDALGRLDRSDLRLVVGADDGDLIRTLHLVDRALGDEDRALPHLDDGAHLRVLARTENVTGVGEEADRRDRSGAHVHVAPREEHVPLVGEHGAVREDELELRVLHGGVALELEVLLLAELIEHAKRIDLRHGREHRLSVDEVADLLLRDSGDARDRGRDPGPRQVEPRLGDGRLEGADRGPGAALRGAGVVELLLADGPLDCQRLGAGHVGVGLGLLELGLELARIDLEQELALRDEAPLLVDAPQEISLHVRADVRVDVALRRADPLPENRLVALDRGRHDDLRRRRRGGLRARAGEGRERKDEDEKASGHAISTPPAPPGTVRTGQLAPRTLRRAVE